jgi:hypothetical protein
MLQGIMGFVPVMHQSPEEHALTAAVEMKQRRRSRQNPRTRTFSLTILIYTPQPQ